MSPLFMRVVFERQERSSAPDTAYIHDKFSGNGSGGGGGEDREWWLHSILHQGECIKDH